MKKVTTLLLVMTLVALYGCTEEKRKNAPDVECGISEGDCDLCAEFDAQSPKFIIAVVGDGVKDETSAMDRKYSVNRAQGEAMWNGIQLAYRHSPYVNEPTIKNLITIKSFDDGGSATCAKRIAECIYTNPCVLAVIGHATSGTTLEGAVYYDKARIPLLMPIATSPNVFYPSPLKQGDKRYENIFRLPPSDDQVQAYAIGHVAIDKLKADRIALIGDISIDAPTYSKPIFQKLDQEILGRTKVYSEEVPRTMAVNVASNIKQTKPDLVVFAGYWTNFQLILGLLKDLYAKERDKPKILLSDGCMSKDLDPYGFEIYVTFPAPDIFDTNLQSSVQLEEIRHFVKEQGYQSYEIFGYDALQLIAQAILESRREGISRASIINALATGKKLNGVVFPYTFIKGENAKSNYYIFDVTRKSFELVSAEDIEKFKASNRGGQ